MLMCQIEIKRVNTKCMCRYIRSVAHVLNVFHSLIHSNRSCITYLSPMLERTLLQNAYNLVYCEYIKYNHRLDSKVVLRTFENKIGSREYTHTAVVKSYRIFIMWGKTCILKEIRAIHYILH